MRVLVTDAGFKNGVTVIRSLSRRGVEVLAAAPTRFAAGLWSKYSKRRLVYPSPVHEPGAFVSWIVNFIRREQVDVVLPVGDATTYLLSQMKGQVEAHSRLPVADWESMAIASSKAATAALAQDIGVPTPKVYSNVEEVQQFPVVVKASIGSGRVRYVNSAGELRRLDTRGAVIQEYVPGIGFGFFAFLNRGKEEAVFMHKRLREYPITGGASTAAQSIKDPVLLNLGLRLLKALKWDGVAMVEFKLDLRDGVYKLMEINPKFWGSLDLAVAAGVDFPWLPVARACGISVVPTRDYVVGLKFQWVVEDLIRGLAIPKELPLVFADLRDPSVRRDWSWDDPAPELIRAVKTMAGTALRVLKGRFRHPHGIPTTHSRIS
jgi:predicted ATP-grasp superfamily ATP-dependent carboligase